VKVYIETTHEGRTVATAVNPANAVEVQQALEYEYGVVARIVGAVSHLPADWVMGWFVKGESS
jgi:hypothetical protein